MSTFLSSLLLGLGQLLDLRLLQIMLKSLGVTLILFVILAFAGWFAMDWALGWLGLADELFYGAGGVRGLVSALLALLGLWIIWRVVAMGVIQFYAEDVVKAVEAQHYPEQASVARDLPVSEQLRSALAAAGRALLANLIAAPFALALLFTAIGPAIIFWLVNAVLLGRELQDMVWLRHRQSKADNAPMSRSSRFFLGGVTAALLAIPFANFLAPVLGAASATHLVHRHRRNSGIS